MDVGLLRSILTVTIQAGTSLVFATVGEIFTERSGILNLGLEGIMIMGAVTGFAAVFHSQSLLVAVLVAMLVGALLASIHAFLTISLRTDQVVTGLALTLFGGGLASFLGQRLGPGGKPLVGEVGPKFTKVPLPWLSEIPYVGQPLFKQDPLVYVMYLLVPLAGFYIYRTRLGLHLRAVGENPATADAMGINVTRTRYAYTIFGGMLIGLGGAHLSLAYTPGWTENLTGGRGWIAIALVIFATWDPFRALIGAVLFGGVNAIQFRLQAIEAIKLPGLLGWLEDILNFLKEKPAFLAMLPYLATIVVLVAITWWETLSKRVGAPAALGLPYVREERG